PDGTGSPHHPAGEPAPVFAFIPYHSAHYRKHRTNHPPAPTALSSWILGTSPLPARLLLSRRFTENGIWPRQPRRNPAQTRRHHGSWAAGREKPQRWPTISGTRSHGVRYSGGH